jgi:hypothetical protein
VCTSREAMVARGGGLVQHPALEMWPELLAEDV